MPALQKALDNGWLSVDATANTGSGTTPQLNPGADIPAPAVPTTGPSVPVEVPSVAPDSTEAVYQGGTWGADSWGGFTQGGWKQSPANVSESDGGNAYANVLARPVSSVQQTLNEYAGYDAHSQSTDDKGWMQNTPSGRSAVRRRLWADDVGYRFHWPVTAENPVQKRLAAARRRTTRRTGRRACSTARSCLTGATSSTAAPATSRTRRRARPAPPPRRTRRRASAGAASDGEPGGVLQEASHLGKGRRGRRRRGRVPGVPRALGRGVRARRRYLEYRPADRLRGRAHRRTRPRSPRWAAAAGRSQSARRPAG